MNIKHTHSIINGKVKESLYEGRKNILKKNIHLILFGNCCVIQT